MTESGRQHQPIDVLMLIVIACLAAAGGVLLTIAQDVPPHSSNAYDAAYDTLMTQAAVGNPNYDVLSTQFHALQDQYRTNKWLYTDLAYLSFALAAVVAITELLGTRWKMLTRSCSNAIVIVPLFVASYVAFFASIVADAFHAYWRGLLPPWADTLAIPLFSAVIACALLAAPTAIFFLWPLVRGRTKVSSLAYIDASRPLISTLATIVYLLMAGTLCALAALSATQAGSWLLFPSCLGLGWLALNARVLTITPKL